MFKFKIINSKVAVNPYFSLLLQPIVIYLTCQFSSNDNVNTDIEERMLLSILNIIKTDLQNNYITILFADNVFQVIGEFAKLAHQERTITWTGSN